MGNGVFVSPSVTLRLVSGETCSGDDLTFSCEASGTDILTWTIVGLSDVIIPEGAFGQGLNSFERFTSTDDTLGPDPSRITIQNVTAADNGATVQCSILNGDMTNSITLSIRE